ncbi:late embryogenesis abundant protein [Apiospora saccharicola]
MLSILHSRASDHVTKAQHDSKPTHASDAVVTRKEPPSGAARSDSSPWVTGRPSPQSDRHVRVKECPALGWHLFTDGSSWDSRSPVRRPPSLPRRQGGGLERAPGAVGNATGTAKGTNNAAGDAVKGAEDKAEGFGEKAPFEIPELAPCHGQGRRPVRRPLRRLLKDQNGNILGKLAGIQDFIGKEIKAINEKGPLLGKDNAVLDQANLAPESTVDAVSASKRSRSRPSRTCPAAPSVRACPSTRWATSSTGWVTIWATSGAESPMSSPRPTAP